MLSELDCDLPKTTVTASESDNGTFGGIALSPVMIRALAEANYLTPTPVQAGFIPHALNGKDVMGQARTGTGKTAAFLIPILEQLEAHKERQGPQALILVPTRELAVQVHGELERLAHGRRLRSVALYGGKPIRGQIEKLRRGVTVVVGTPGRILDHISRDSLALSGVAFVVLDEADRMLDIGFRPDIEKILKRCPASRQTMLLSATVPPSIERLAHRYMRDPIKLDFSPENLSVETIQQFYCTVDQSQKFDVLTSLLEREQPQQAIVFCRTRRGTERLFQRLKKRFRSVGCIHGDMQQSARDRVMERFRAGKLQLLMATDVVGRGIDVTSISHIVNYDIPQFCDDYIHRVGRTGRMGREGIAFTFVTPEQGPELTRIEQRIDKLLQRDDISGFQRAAIATAAETDPQSEPALEPAPEPAPKTAAPPLSRRGRPPKRYRRPCDRRRSPCVPASPCRAVDSRADCPAPLLLSPSGQHASRVSDHDQHADDDGDLSLGDRRADGGRRGGPRAGGAANARSAAPRFAVGRGPATLWHPPSRGHAPDLVYRPSADPRSGQTAGRLRSGGVPVVSIL